MQQKYKDYLLIFILLFFSGNALAVFWFAKFSTIIAFIIIWIFVGNKNIFSFTRNTNFGNILLTLIIIFLFKLFILGSTSWFGNFNFVLKIFSGGVIVYSLKGKLKFQFFNTIYFLALISLIFYVFVNLLLYPLYYIDINGAQRNYFLYAITDGHLLKDAGMFWEPGAFAGVITLCLVLNFNNLGFYWKSHRLKLLIIILALLLSQSTTGYLSFFVILLFYFINLKNKFTIFFVLPFLFIFFIYLYNTTDFLKGKIENQYSLTEDQGVGELSNTRFGSIIFDWYYIKKHPIIGNGMHEKTRYADHQYIFNGFHGTDAIGSGNGFSNYFASMGGFFIFAYFYLLFKGFKNDGILFSIVAIIVVFFNLQGEQWLNYMLYLGLPFLNFSAIKYKNNSLF